MPGHAVWIHDVLAFRASPAAWNDLLIWVTAADAREPTAEEAKKLHRLGDDKVVAVLRSAGAGTIEIAARAENRDALLGPYADADAGLARAPGVPRARAADGDRHDAARAAREHPHRRRHPHRHDPTISLDGLVGWAKDHACTLVFHHGVGDFVHPDAPLLDILGPPPGPDAARSLEGMVALGQERTIAQDPAFALRVMVDVANRARSAAINDPTTAVQVLDYVEDLLLVIGRTDFSGRGVFCDSDGTPRIVLPSRGWEDYLSLGVTEIRQYGGSSVQVVRRLRSLLLRLQQHVLPDHRAAVAEELARLEAAVAEQFGAGVDLDRASVPDRQGLGGPAGVAAHAPAPG